MFKAMFPLLFLSAASLSVSSAQSLFTINPGFGNVPIQCSGGYAYQSADGGTCAGTAPQQAFNIEAGIGWKFTPHLAATGSTGITSPNTGFNPPPFNGLPFSTAAFLQGGSTATVLQTIHGFVPGVTYQLSFYLGSRYANGSFDGNQTVQVLVDDRVIGTWSLVSRTPFTLRTVYFSLTSGGSHAFKFVGRTAGDHTAFFSGVSIAVAVDDSPGNSPE